MENMVADKTWWQGRRVFLTGHTGFMGGWLCSFLLSKGAQVHGFALEPPTEPSFFDSVDLADKIASSVIGDVRDLDGLDKAITKADPEVIFHLAAQPLVLEANADPVTTFSTNVMGTVNLLEAARGLENLKSMLLVTTDKVYKNIGKEGGYVEGDELGGKEPYSASKAASEFVISAYHQSYFDKVGMVALRVGNIIGGGDWAANRLIPDAIRCFTDGAPLVLRHPNATRPWQHVLDPLPGYLDLAQRLAHDKSLSGGWNFGPAQEDCQPVGVIGELMATAWGNGANVEAKENDTIFEEKFLSLDSGKAIKELGWGPRWRLDDALKQSVAWYLAEHQGKDMWAFTSQQIAEFEQANE